MLLLASAVLLPAACMLWMMSKAVDNERLAVRQVLGDVYRGQLARLRTRWETRWEMRSRALDEQAAGKTPAEAFAAIVLSGTADGVLLDDRTPQRTSARSYPDTTPSLPGPAERDPAWERAEELEYALRKPAEAAAAYAALAERAADANRAAQAVTARARCLARAGERNRAIDLYAAAASDPRRSKAVDAGGRCIAVDAGLRVLELLGESTDPRVRETAARLAARALDYSDASLGASQRRLLLQALLARPELCGDSETVGRLRALAKAEEAAAAVWESGTTPTERAAFSPSEVPDWWGFASASSATQSRRITALFHTETILRDLRQLVEEEGLPSGAEVELSAASDAADLLHVVSVGDRFPGRFLAIRRCESDSTDAAARSRIATYVLAGCFAVSAASLLAFWAAAALWRQMRAARLKNDLAAAVSHELKTPLASIRLLVDMLLADDSPDPGRVREYLALIAKENARLGRVIDNFLAFSRMERSKHLFVPVEVAPEKVVEAAVDATAERFRGGEREAAPGPSALEVCIDPELPRIAVDVEAMTTALVNLLDNAYKYTGNDKRISLRVRTDGTWVFFDVADNGIGLSPAACRRVFEPFYQADPEATRSRGGCGLGLSIVDYIVREHGGRVSVCSRPGRGSEFTVAVPGIASRDMECVEPKESSSP